MPPTRLSAPPPNHGPTRWRNSTTSITRAPITGLWPNQVARAFGYPLPQYWPNDANNIESIHSGQPTVSGALLSLLGSPGHCSHLLGQDWYGSHREIGVGTHFDERLWSIMTANDGSTRVFLTGVAIATPIGTFAWTSARG